MLARAGSWLLHIFPVALAAACNGGSGDGSGAESTTGGATVGETPTTGDSTGSGTTGSTGGSTAAETTGTPDATTGTTGTTGTTVEPTTASDDSSTTVVDPSTTLGDTSTGEATTIDVDCASCNEIIMGADPSTVCPESQDEFDAYLGCVCGECMAECPDVCAGGSDVPIDCFSCANDAIAGVCSRPANACLADA